MKRLLCLVLLAFSANCFAGTILGATVTNVRADRSGKVMVHFSDSLSGAAACINDTYSNRLSLDTNAAGGRSLLSLVLTAFSTGKKVDAYGTGTCLDYNDLVESMNFAVGRE